MFIKSVLTLVVAAPVTFVVATGVGNMSNSYGISKAREVSIAASTKLVDAKCKKQSEIDVSDCKFNGYFNIIFSH